MDIALLQLDIQWCTPEENMRRAETLIENVAPAQLYVLPEMWATGFAMHPQKVAYEEEHCVALKWMQQQAVMRGCALCGSLAIRTQDGLCRNRHYFVTPSSTLSYDKHHLFTYGGEHKRFTRGDKRVVVEFRGVRFLLQICYDMRFPTFARNSAENPYDVLPAIFLSDED
jgi:predicted amidohydrolase